MKNLLLKLRYNLFKEYIKPKIDWGNLVWKEDFNNPSYEILNHIFYHNHMVMSSECVELQEDGLHLKVIPIKNAPEQYNIWGETKSIWWKIGYIDYKKFFKDYTYGTWVFKVNLPRDSFCAIWFLRHPHPPVEMQFSCNINRIEGNKVFLNSVPSIIPGINWWILDDKRNVIGRIYNYNKILNLITLYEPSDLTFSGYGYIGSDHIIPEIDLMEVLRKNQVGHTIHYGFTRDTYRLYGKGTKVFVPNWDEDYEFALVNTPKGASFYTNGIKTGELNVGLYDLPIYPILNNAVHSANFTHGVSDFIIKSIEFYQ
jgi:hypothetical protein